MYDKENEPEDIQQDPNNRAGRSTTENLFTFNLLAEKEITSKAYETHILMLDMSKTFDTMQRKSLFDELQ